MQYCDTKYFLPCCDVHLSKADCQKRKEKNDGIVVLSIRMEGDVNGKITVNCQDCHLTRRSSYGILIKNVKVKKKNHIH